MKRAWLLIVLFLAFVLPGCLPAEQVASEAIQPTPTSPWIAPFGSTVIEVRTIVVKMVMFPSDRERDFVVLSLDGTHQVFFEESQCMMDNPSHMFGPYDSIKHCQILQPDITQSLITDQAWLNDDLAPFRQYLSCINGWVYQGQKADGQLEWFIEMFGFHAFC